MMKKIYIDPEMIVVKVEMQQMLASSLGMLGDSQDNDDALAPFMEGDGFDFGDDNAFTFEKDSFDFGE